MANHDNVSDILIKNSDISEIFNKHLGSGFANDLADIIGHRHKSIYTAVVSSQFDADRLDYMRRDRLMTGTHHGAIDFDWLIANLEVGSIPQTVDEEQFSSLETFVLGPKAIHAAEAYILGLFQLYPTELLFRIFSLVRDGSSQVTALPTRHPLVLFAQEPDKLEHVLALDDSTVWGALSMLAESNDSVISAFSKRLRDRRLLKCIDVRDRLLEKLGMDDCEAVREKLETWLSEKNKDNSRILIDQGVRDPYKKMQESKGPLNQINVRASPDSVKFSDIIKLSKVVAAVNPFRFFRAYVSENDREARDFLEETIGEEMQNGQHR
jgi:HD superfamily phosphohydrolase